MLDIKYSLSVVFSDELTDIEYAKAEECLEILFTAHEKFCACIEENGLVLYQTTSGYEICGSIFKEWFEEYIKENPAVEKTKNKNI